MEPLNSGEVTTLLKEWDDPETLNKVIVLVYEDLRKIGRSYFRNSNASATLQPTALINEVYLQLAGSGSLNFSSRSHFINTAALMMRQLMGKYARAKSAQKRGGEARDVTFEDVLSPQATGLNPDMALALEEAIARLHQLDPRKARLAELRLYLNLDFQDIATALDVTDRTIRRDWQFIKTWLAKELAS